MKKILFIAFLLCSSLLFAQESKTTIYSGGKFSQLRNYNADNFTLSGNEMPSPRYAYAKFDSTDFRGQDSVTLIAAPGTGKRIVLLGYYVSNNKSSAKTAYADSCWITLKYYTGGVYTQWQKLYVQSKASTYYLAGSLLTSPVVVIDDNTALRALLSRKSVPITGTIEPWVRVLYTVIKSTN